jgi:hypothetical protein
MCLDGATEEPSSTHEAAVQPVARPCPASFELTRSARHGLLNGWPRPFASEYSGKHEPCHG